MAGERARGHRARLRRALRLTGAAGFTLAVIFAAPGLPGSQPGPLADTEPSRIDVHGRVVLSGARPATPSIDMTGDAYCERVNRGPIADPAIQTDAAGNLANVVVYVKEAPPGPAPAPRDSVVLDQQNCMYTPAVVALRTRQVLVIRNSDETLHNVHVRPSRNREFNIGQPLKGTRSSRTFTAPELGMTVSCDIHGWMRASIAVFDHPYYAVTGSDGTFSLTGLPPGEYVIEAWHAVLGTQQQTVTVAPGSTPELSFTFTAR